MQELYLLLHISVLMLISNSFFIVIISIIFTIVTVNFIIMIINKIFLNSVKPIDNYVRAYIILLHKTLPNNPSMSFCLQKTFENVACQLKQQQLIENSC